jgi:transcriptional regulator with PAS, ATPase and Fis domain
VAALLWRSQRQRSGAATKIWRRAGRANGAREKSVKRLPQSNLCEKSWTLAGARGEARAHAVAYFFRLWLWICTASRNIMRKYFPLTTETPGRFDSKEGKIMTKTIDALLDQTAGSLPWQTIGMVANSTIMKKIFDLILKLAGSDANVLIMGESGTGKEMVAQAIHHMGNRAAQPFVPVNCAAIPEELLESELFGHVRGAFTGAINPRQGRFQLAHGGTLFLDEIGEMSPKLQVKLLRVLQERVFEPVGSDKAVRVDVRVVAATNRDLRQAVGEGSFREDLFYRLNVLPIYLPPLRERREDIPLLIAHFLNFQSRKKGKGIEAIEEEALALLERYDWPGNVRELENLIERLVVLNEDGVIRAKDIPGYFSEPRGAKREPIAAVALPSEGVNLDEFLKVIEVELMRQALERTGGNKSRAAELLKLNRTTLVERLRRQEQIARQFPLPLAAVGNLTRDSFSLTPGRQNFPATPMSGLAVSG